ncbi:MULTISPECIES: DUF2249 domain-containing protein [unclassified Rhizobium]|uniref:DUF2249 domain-containing protein n=1 Tax=unclassified Rhizobium TaxID=2613769 RepID=UPI0006FA82FB|nr:MULTISPECIES: DUF2249 domain-containing protein [unclassified Rhizobium]KQV39955.1 universal stress protein [Rhizobium sp. Root1212]KRD31665.1 universal stress protein [Rhizobium sp. Root268]
MSLAYKELDVRPLLEAGVEPFVEIMTTVDRLGPKEGLRLLAPFKPQPLFSVMERKGYLYELTELAGGDYEVRFFPKNAEVLTSGDAGDADHWAEPSIELDLTDLDPPQPMVKILQTLETMPPGSVLFAVLGREPVFLFPELVKRGHQWVGNHDKTGTAFRMMIRRGEAKP